MLQQVLGPITLQTWTCRLKYLFIVGHSLFQRWFVKIFNLNLTHLKIRNYSKTCFNIISKIHSRMYREKCWISAGKIKLLFPYFPVRGTLIKTFLGVFNVRFLHDSLCNFVFVCLFVMFQNSWLLLFIYTQWYLAFGNKWRHNNVAGISGRGILKIYIFCLWKYNKWFI